MSHDCWDYAPAGDEAVKNVIFFYQICAFKWNRVFSSRQDNRSLGYTCHMTQDRLVAVVLVVVVVLVIAIVKTVKAACMNKMVLSMKGDVV